MTSKTRLFVARLASANVFDPNGDQLGRIADLVVTLHTGSNPPRVLGLLLEVAHRRRVFVPIGRVRSFSVGQVVVTGLVNLRRFQQRNSETLVYSELLDRRATLLDSDSNVRIVDVGIERTPKADWYLKHFYVRRGGGFRRRGESFVLRWNEIDSLHGTQSPPVDGLLSEMDDKPAMDVAEMLGELPLARRLQVARSMEDARLADVLEELPLREQVEIMSVLDVERAADILEEMDPDDATDLVADLKPAQAAALLERMEPDEAEDIRRLLKYDDRTAGGMMTTEPIIMNVDATVVEALALVRQEDLSPAVASQVYVVRAPTETPTGRYIGAVHIQALLRVPPTTMLSEIVDSDLTPIGPDTPLEDVTEGFAAYNLVAVPVIDDGEHLLGAVTVDDVLDHVLPEDWRETRLQEEGSGDG